MSTRSANSTVASRPPSVLTSLSMAAGAATLAGVLAAGVVWASQWSLPSWEDDRSDELTERDLDEDDDGDDWAADPVSEPDDWSLDFNDALRWRLTE